MNSLVIKTDWRRRLLTVGGMLLLLVAVGAYVSSRAEAKSSASQSGQHVLTIYDSGQEIGILTDADTLREAFEQAGIELAKTDITEPSLDEELVSATYEINVYRSRPVLIDDEGSRTKIMTPYVTPKQIAKQAGITLQDEDKVTLQHSTNILSDGAFEKMTIERATPFTLVLYGKKIASFTMAETVGAMLEEKELTIGKRDTLSVKPSAKIKAGMTVEIWRNGKQTVTEEEVVKRPVHEIKDADREVGYRAVRTPGKDGKRSVTYEIVMRNGREVSRKEISSVVIQKPVKEVVVVGAKVTGPEEIMSLIRAAAKSKGIDAQRVLLIAKCESGFNPRADSGYYKGIFQHDPGYWPARAEKYGYPGASYFDVEAQIGVSTSMMAEGGWSHWGCDPGPQ